MYLPNAPAPYPVVVCIHGGAWRQGDKERMREYADVLVDAGIAAVAPNHRLTGTDPHPAQQDDILAVLDWIAASANEYGFDPRRVGITGSSSGGHLTSLVGLKATRSGAADRGYTVRCMMPVCGPFDMVRRVAGRPDSEVYHALLTLQRTNASNSYGTRRRQSTSTPMHRHAWRFTESWMTLSRRGSRRAWWRRSKPLACTLSSSSFRVWGTAGTSLTRNHPSRSAARTDSARSSPSICSRGICSQPIRRTAIPAGATGLVPTGDSPVPCLSGEPRMNSKE